MSIIFEATSLGGVESLIEAPATSSHMFIPPEVRLESGIAPGFIRLSVGLENVDGSLVRYFSCFRRLTDNISITESEQRLIIF